MGEISGIGNRGLFITLPDLRGEPKKIWYKKGRRIGEVTSSAGTAESSIVLTIILFCNLTNCVRKFSSTTNDAIMTCELIVVTFSDRDFRLLLRDLACLG
jgi:hypothetical protein